MNLYQRIILWYQLRQFSVKQLTFSIYVVTQTEVFIFLGTLFADYLEKETNIFKIYLLNRNPFHSVVGLVTCSQK